MFRTRLIYSQVQFDQLPEQIFEGMAPQYYCPVTCQYFDLHWHKWPCVWASATAGKGNHNRQCSSSSRKLPHAHTGRTIVSFWPHRWHAVSPSRTAGARRPTPSAFRLLPKSAVVPALVSFQPSLAGVRTEPVPSQVATERRLLLNFRLH